MISKTLQNLAEWLVKEPGIPMLDPWHYLNGKFGDVIFDQYSQLAIEHFLLEASTSFDKRRMQCSLNQNIKSQRMADSTLIFANKLCEAMKIDGAIIKEWFPFYAENGSRVNQDLIDLALTIALTRRDQGEHWRNKVVCSQAAHGNLPLFGKEKRSRFIQLPLGPDFQMDDLVLSRIFSRGHREAGSVESDVCLLKLTAPTTDLNVLEIPGPLSIAEIVKRKIWVHVDCCLGINLLLLPTAQSKKLLELLAQPWVSSFSWDPHKVLGLPNLGVLIIKNKADRKLFKLMGPKYFMSNGGIGGTTIGGDALAHLAFRLEALGHSGLRYLSYYSHQATRYLATSLEMLGYKIISDPCIRSLVVEVPSSEKYSPIEYQLKILTALKTTKNWHLAKVNSVLIEKKIVGIRIVLPIGIAWNKSSIEYIANVFDQCCKQEELGKFASDPALVSFLGWNENIMRLPEIDSINLKKAPLIEFPRAWLREADDILWRAGRNITSDVPIFPESVSKLPGRPHRSLRKMARSQFRPLKIRIAKLADLKF